MKNRKHRIFIITNTISNTNRPEVASQQEPEIRLAYRPLQKMPRGESKRKRLFDEAAPKLQVGNREGKYQYQIKPHINSESLATICTCDIQKPNIERVNNLPIKQQKASHKNQQDAKFSCFLFKKQDGSQFLSKDTHKQISSSRRRHIFEGNNSNLLTANHNRSTFSGSKRKNIFLLHESPHNISFNTSISKQRRRIFSQDNRTTLPLNQQRIYAIQMQSIIKQQQQKDKSIITELLEVS